MPVFHLPRNAAMIPDKPYAKWRHVIIYIDYRNLDRVEWAKIVARIHIFLRAQSEARLADIQRELRNYFTYEMCKRCVLAPWTLRVLHTLVLDVEFVYCTIGCCRLEVIRDQVFGCLLVGVEKVRKIMLKGL